MDADGQDEFDGFVRARYADLLRFARALTGSPEDGADLLHDALAATLRAWDRVESHGDPEGYIRRAMVNRNISLWRRRTREHVHLSLAPDPPPTADHESRVSVWAAIRALPPRQRTVVALRFYEELPVSQVADLMGCSDGTVKSQTAKAVAKLRLALADSSFSQEVSDGPVHP